MLTELRTAKCTYSLDSLVKAGGTCDVYECSFNGQQGIAKYVRDPANNGRLRREVMALTMIREEQEKLAPYFPEPLEQIRHQDKTTNIEHVAVIYPKLDEFCTLEAVHAEYPKGLDPKDLAWIYRRVLVALGAAHQSGVSHGQVYPGHVIIHPTRHGLLLLDWMQASFSHELSADKVLRSQQDDLHSAALVALSLLGALPGSPLQAPDTVPLPLRTCLRAMATQAIGNAWDVLKVFDDVIARLWGRRRYRPLVMPAPQP